MVNPIHCLIRLCVKIYKKNEERKYLNLVDGNPKDALIMYPCVITKHDGDLFEMGDNATILPDARIQLYSDLVGKHISVRIGQNCYIGRRFTVLGAGNVTLGESVLIADDVMIDTKNHGMNPLSEVPYMNQKLCDVNDVVIANGTWIGAKVTILNGVKIGKKCVIAAGAVVTNSIPDYCIAAGIPARIVKKYNFENKEWELIKDDLS